MVNTLKNVFYIMFLFSGGNFWVFLGSFCHIFLYFLRTVQDFLMEFWTDVSGIALLLIFFFFFFFTSCSYLLTAIYSNLGPILCIFFHVFRNSQYFMMIFCTQLLGNTLLASKQKNMLGQPVLETF